MSFLLAFALSLILIPAARRVGRALQLVDRPGSLKIHPEPVSVLGGVAVITATLGALAVTQKGLSATVSASIGLALVTGIIDDARPLPAWTRVALLLVAGVALSLDLVGLREVGAIGIVALVLVCSNAVNLIDGQDGLAGGLTAIVAVTLAVLVGPASSQEAGLGFALSGALLGFLLWNRPPARVFLGNSGAYAVGACLAVLAAQNVLHAGWRGLLSAGVCLGVFACELVLTVLRRLRSAKPLSRGDRGHSYDLLADRLASRAKSTVIFWGLGVLAGAVALAVDALPLAAGLVLVSVASGVSLAMALIWSRAARTAGRPAEGSRIWGKR
jgi:UDP-GlcNAc:undecaprenyl-phosphate/decaprenyl-phosphate GlcNAc-1-phosphate transferase